MPLSHYSVSVSVLYLILSDTTVCNFFFFFYQKTLEISKICIIVIVPQPEKVRLSSAGSQDTA